MPPMSGPFRIAMSDLIEVENASSERLVQLATRNGLNLNKYAIEENGE